MSRNTCNNGSPTNEELVERYQGGDFQALARLIEANQGLIRRAVYKVTKDPQRYPDLMQEGNIGLVTAAQRYDHTKAVKFATFAYQYCWGYVRHYCNRREPMVRKIEGAMPVVSIEEECRPGVSLRDVLVEPDGSALQLADQAFVWGYIERALTAEEFDIVRGRFYEDETMGRIAKKQGKSRPTRHRLLKIALRKLRKGRQ